jgi:hypothetical protein
MTLVEQISDRSDICRHLYSGYLWIIALGDFVPAARAPPIAMNLTRKRSAAFCATNYLKNRINGENLDLAIEG